MSFILNDMKVFGKIFGHQRDEVNVISWLNCRDGCFVKWCKVSSNGVMLRQYVHHVNWGCVVCWRRNLGYGDVTVIGEPWWVFLLPASKRIFLWVIVVYVNWYVSLNFCTGLLHKPGWCKCDVHKLVVIYLWLSNLSSHHCHSDARFQWFCCNDKRFSIRWILFCV